MRFTNPFIPTQRRTATAVLVTAAVLVAGCSSMSEREQGTAKGAGAGAVAGAILGSVTGGSAGRGAVIGGAVGAVAGNLWSKHMEDKRKALAQASQGTGVEVARTDDNRLKLNVPSDVSFDTGRADIKPQMRPVLDEVGRNLDPNVRVTIVGHTDSTGSDAINDPLSRERAVAVRDYLASRGVSTSRVSVTGRGSHEPVASNDTEAGRAANRRVEIFLAEQG
ncbi:OmpA family protein [Roseateles sp.]|uniref:OmpA family protein n=1 Tax=Roseateles sp. TaxID=1971397 RepID=UPI0039E80634